MANSSPQMGKATAYLIALSIIVGCDVPPTPSAPLTTPFAYDIKLRDNCDDVQSKIDNLDAVFYPIGSGIDFNRNFEFSCNKDNELTWFKMIASTKMGFFQRNESFEYWEPYFEHMFYYFEPTLGKYHSKATRNDPYRWTYTNAEIELKLYLSSYSDYYGFEFTVRDLDSQREIRKAEEAINNDLYRKSQKELRGD